MIFHIHLFCSRNHALTPDDMVFVTLRFIASGCFLQNVGDMQGIDKSTASRVVAKVLRCIAIHFKHLISLPETQEDKRVVQQGFYNIARFPKCVGSIDCTHVKIISPGGQDPENYRNRKGFFSFNVQAICTADLKIQNIVCRWPGGSHDSTIFANSRVKTLFENGHFGDGLLVGDSGYGVKPYLITPLLNPRTPAEHLFNESQIRTRNPVERCFGVWKRRFPILAHGIRLAKDKVESIVVATAALHNFAIIMNNPLPMLDEELEAAINFVNNISENFLLHQDQEGLINIQRAALIRYYENLL